MELRDYGLAADRVKAVAGLATILTLMATGLPTTIPAVPIYASLYGTALIANAIRPDLARTHTLCAALGGGFWAGYALDRVVAGARPQASIVLAFLTVLVVTHHLAAIRRLTYFEVHR